jgi:enoyl-CoA hydratase/carnithine racemase
MTPTSGSISVERDPGAEIATITLRNESKRNALEPAMLDALCDALARLPDEGVRAVVLTGAGDRAFSAGYDIGALERAATAATRDGADDTHNPLARVLAAIARGPLPVVAALNGLAIGGGCELAATCDLRVAHPGVTLAMPPVRLGIIYAPEGLARFVALIGMARTRELFLTAHPVPAERALAWGLVDRVVPPEEVLPTARTLAAEIARGAPLAVRGTRRLLEELLPRLTDDAAREIDALRREAWTSADAAEARAAFRDKRPPRFTGR